MSVDVGRLQDVERAIFADDDNISSVGGRISVPHLMHPDVVSVSWFAKKVAWWRNPGKAARDGKAWKETPLHTGFNVEFALLVDLDNDGKAASGLTHFDGGDLSPRLHLAPKV